MTILFICIGDFNIDVAIIVDYIPIIIYTQGNEGEQFWLIHT